MDNMLRKFTRFVSVGSVATAIQYSLLTGLVEVADLPTTVASTIGFLVSASGNYLLNRRFTFQSEENHSTALPKFFAVAASGMVINAVMFSQFEAHTNLHYLVAQACATVAVLLWNFIVNAVWTFKPTS
jgi:putative flippase GtrA